MEDERRVAFVAPNHSVALSTLYGHIRHFRGSYAAAGFCRGVDVLLTARSDGMIERRDARTTALLADYDGLRGTPTMLASNRSEEHTSELQSLMRISYAVFCLKKKNRDKQHRSQTTQETPNVHTTMITNAKQKK